MKVLRLIACMLVLLTLYACTPATPSVQLPLESLPAETVPVDNTGYVVENPLPYPDYTFDGEPSVLELRQTVVQATRDLLSIQWSTPRDLIYNKSGPVSHKLFQHMADTTYAGTPYSNGSTGIFQFYEYYDSQTGRFWYPNTATQLSRNLGNSCADSVIWGYDTVCTTLSAGYYPSTMLYKNGYYPVGDYTYNFEINSYSKLPTENIVKLNGKAVMINSYAQIMPGDALVSSTDNHAMMAIGKAYVAYLSNGEIDSKSSYVMIQDQRGGHGAGFFEQNEDGKIIQYSGRTSAKYTFDELLQKHYLPVAPAELLGTKDYEHATVTATKESCTTLEELKDVTVTSNYPFAVINVIVKDSFGNSKVIEKILFSGTNDGPPKEYPLSKLKSLGSYIEVGNPQVGCTVSIEVVVSTGERFIPTVLTF